jgi:hypothetical protein
MTFEELLAKEKQKHAPRKSPAHHESRLQAACVRWFRYQHPSLLIFAIPNGGWRNEIEAKIMKNEGVMAGVADLEILLPNGRCLFIEMKTAKGRQSEAQRGFQKWCDDNGHTYMVCRSLEGFIEVVNNFIACAIATDI